MLLLNVLLRPSLMVIGFIMAYVLISSFSMFGLLMVYKSIESTAGQGGFGVSGPIAFLFSMVSTLIIVGMLLTIIIHKSLSLITWLPENAVKWAGGEVNSLGEQSDERRVAAVFAQMGSVSPGMPKPGANPNGGGNGGGAGDGNPESPGGNGSGAGGNGSGAGAGGDKKPEAPASNAGKAEVPKEKE